MKPEKLKNKMREIKIEKVSLNIGGTGEKLDKGQILLEKITGKKSVRVKATKRIPNWDVRPGLEVGVKVTMRGKEAEKVLERLLEAIENRVKERQMQKNFLSFGIKEYIDIPGMEYLREVGIMGLEVTVVFVRAGKRVERKKIKHGKTRRQDISREEIAEFMLNKFKTQTLKKVKRE
jgi:large subunit ribosomal protein L5